MMYASASSPWRWRCRSCQPRELATRFTDSRRLFRLGILGLSAAQGPRPDHQPGLRRHQGGRRVQGQDHRPQPALADRLHLPQGHRLGLVLSVDHPRRLLALHHRLEAVHDHAGRRRHRHAAAGARRHPGALRRASCTNHDCSATTAPATSPAIWRNGSKRPACDHVRGAPCHPQTQGKIERWHQTLKNRILLENYYLPGDLEAHIDRFVDHYNHRRYHESLQNLTPADVYFGRGQTILLATRKDQTRDHQTTTIAAPAESRLTCKPQPSQSLPSRKPQTVAKHLTTDTWLHYVSS